MVRLRRRRRERKEEERSMGRERGCCITFSLVYTSPKIGRRTIVYVVKGRFGDMLLVLVNDVSM